MRIVEGEGFSDFWVRCNGDDSIVVYLLKFLVRSLSRINWMIIDNVLGSSSANKEAPVKGTRMFRRETALSKRGFSNPWARLEARAVTFGTLNWSIHGELMIDLRMVSVLELLGLKERRFVGRRRYRRGSG